jgi:predicted phosphohydrolase
MRTIRKIERFFIFLVFFTLFSLNNNPILSSGVQENKEVKIIIVGDTQHIGFWESLYWDYWYENNVDKTKKILSEIANRNPFMVINLGDMVSDGGSASEWKNFDEDNKPIRNKNIPYYAVYGNHEYFSDETSAYINFYLRSPQLKTKKWYSLIVQNIGLIMLNSNFDHLTEKEDKEQINWYLNELDNMGKNDQIKFVCVLCHHPPYTNSTIVNPSKEIRELFVPPFQKQKKTALFFSGHCHSYEKFIEGGKCFIVSGGGGGPRQKLDIDKSTRKFNDQFDGPAIRFFHFCELIITENSVRLKIIKLNDNSSFETADEIFIDRP